MIKKLIKQEKKYIKIDLFIFSYAYFIYLFTYNGFTKRESITNRERITN